MNSFKNRNGSATRSSAAESYVRAGIAIKPLHYVESDGGCSCKDGHACPPERRGKHPAWKGSHGIRSASTSREVWSKRPFNIAWVLRGLERVLDVDGAVPPGFYGLSLDRVKEASRGSHVDFYGAVTPGPIPGVGDVKGPGGYVLLPPSVHPSGHVYRWLSGDEKTPIPIAPLEALERIQAAREEAIREAPEPSVRVPRTILVPRLGVITDPAAHGVFAACAHSIREAKERNNAVNRAAYWLGGFVGGGGIAYDDARRFLIEAGMSVGLDEAEAARAADSGISAGSAKPLQLRFRAEANSPSTRTSSFGGAAARGWVNPVSSASVRRISAEELRRRWDPAFQGSALFRKRQTALAKLAAVHEQMALLHDGGPYKLSRHLAAELAGRTDTGNVWRDNRTLVSLGLIERVHGGGYQTKVARRTALWWRWVG